MKIVKTKTGSSTKVWGSATLLLALLVEAVNAPGGESRPSVPVAQRSRQPVALLLTDGGKTLVVANRRSGSLSVIDAKARTVVGRIRCWPRPRGPRDAAWCAIFACSRPGGE